MSADPEAPDAGPLGMAGPGTVALNRLPVQLRMLVRIMGEVAAYLMVQAWGGTPFTVPKTVHSPQFTRLAEVVGLQAALALVAELPGETLQLPKYDGVLRQLLMRLRHQRVVDLRRDGARLADVALTTGYTVRHVINILHSRAPALAEPAENLQTDLFADLEALKDDSQGLPGVPALA